LQRIRRVIYNRQFNVDVIVGSADAYVIVKFKEAKEKTPVVPDSLDPKWKQESSCFILYEIVLLCNTLLVR
jgi:hypothetical protein